MHGLISASSGCQGGDLSVLYVLIHTVHVNVPGGRTYIKLGSMDPAFLNETMPLSCKPRKLVTRQRKLVTKTPKCDLKILETMRITN